MLIVLLVLDRTNPAMGYSTNAVAWVLLIALAVTSVLNAHHADREAASGLKPTQPARSHAVTASRPTLVRSVRAICAWSPYRNSQ
jgi:hypothetical protein